MLIIKNILIWNKKKTWDLDWYFIHQKLYIWSKNAKKYEYKMGIILKNSSYVEFVSAPLNFLVPKYIHFDV